MEEKLRAIVARIEASSIPQEEKQELYTVIRDALQATVWPVLLKYMPKERLTELSEHPEMVNVDTYTKLIEDTIKDGEALKEIAHLMDEVMDEVNKALDEK